MRFRNSDGKKAVVTFARLVFLLRNIKKAGTGTAHSETLKFLYLS